MNQLVVSPLFGVHAKQLQDLPTPTGEFTGNGPKGSRNAEIISGENTRCDDRRGGAQNLINQACLKCCHDMRCASELRRYVTRSVDTTPFRIFDYE